jgi:lipoate-protein ligase B
LKSVSVLQLPRSPYRDVLALQRTIHDEVARGARGDTWIVVEHDPVITLGRNANRENVVAPAEMLAARGVDIVEVERGGDVTYHGPGQLVVYPIVRLERFREVVPMVSALEAAVVGTLAQFGIAAHARSEHRGVYVGNAAICAVGLAVRRMTSMHGLALNVSTALDYDTLIVPCGTPRFGITSMERELGRAVETGRVRESLLEALAEAFHVEVEIPRA